MRWTAKKSCTRKLALELRRRLNTPWILEVKEMPGEKSQVRTISARTRASRGSDSQQEPPTTETRAQGGNPKDPDKCTSSLGLPSRSSTNLVAYTVRGPEAPSWVPTRLTPSAAVRGSFRALPLACR